jgi:hypothetical protein
MSEKNITEELYELIRNSKIPADDIQTIRQAIYTINSAREMNKSLISSLEYLKNIMRREFAGRALQALIGKSYIGWDDANLIDVAVAFADGLISRLEKKGKDVENEKA